MHLIKNKVITLIVALAFSVSGFSQFKINEYSCANVSGGPANIAGSPDWFEIYNTTSTPKSIAGFYVSDDRNYVGKWQFPINTTIPGQGFLLVFASGLDTVTPSLEYHTNFDLLQTKPEMIILSNNQGVIVDSITIRRHQHNHTWGRVPNGNGAWKVFPKNNISGNPTGTPGATNVGVKSFTGYLPPPDFSLPSGFYNGPQTVSLDLPAGTTGLLQPTFTGAGSPTPSLIIGSDPTFNPGTGQSQVYVGTPISIDSTTVIRAYLDTSNLGGGGKLPSFVVTNTYFISGANAIPNRPGEFFNTDGITLPTISVSYDPATSGTFPGNGAGIAYRYMVSLEYFDKNHTPRFKTIGIGTGTSGDDIVFPGIYSGFKYSANDEYGYNYTNKYQLYTDGTLGASARTEQTTIHLKIAGDDNFPYTDSLSGGAKPSVHFRDALGQTYGMKNNLDLDGVHYQPCIMYINGRYAGIYEIRENFDTEYTKFYYGTDNIQSLEKDGASFIGTPNAASDWGSLVNFITSNNMANDSLRQIADSLLNFGSLIDLIIYNSYTVNGGFPTKAAWWRAPDSISGNIKWRYRMFDMDDIMGLEDNSASLPNLGFDASVCQYESTYGATTDSSLAHLAIFTSLMASDTFKAQFINRYSYLLNNSLRCPPIISHLTYIRNLLSPEYAQHLGNFANFGETAIDDTTWNRNIDTMKYWINQRCPTINEDIKTCYNVTGPFRFCTDVEPPSSGTVYLNTVGYPEAHSDMYFGNILFDAIGTPEPNYTFDHWELEGFTLPDSMLTNDSLHWRFDSISCIKAFFKLKEPYQLIGEPSVPTGFSPNGDGNNDLLNVYGTLNVSDYNFQVYNRWGQKIFESTDKTKGWDGTYKGQEVPVGVYAYVFKVTLEGKLIQKSGSITLIR